MNRCIELFATLALASLLGTATAQAPATSAPAKPTTPHNIGSAKLIIGAVKQNQAFYEKMFGMQEVAHYQSETYDEPIMGFDGGARIALFSPKAAPALKKSQFPVALIYTPEFDAVVKRIEAAKHPILRLPAAQSGAFKIAIARDPSGNAIE